jgi:hypothetical protein
MGTQVTAGSSWPEVGQRDPNPRAHGRKIKTEISALMEHARAKQGKGKAKAYPFGKVNELFRSILDFLDKEPAGPAGNLHPEATTKGDLEALAARLVEAMSVQPRVSPTASRLSYAQTLSSPPHSIPQSALTRMSSSSVAQISSRSAREIKVKTNFNTDNRPRPGHSRTSQQIVDMANQGIEKAGLSRGVQGIRNIEMANVQVSGDYILWAKDAATAERLTLNGAQWVTCLGGNAEVVTPAYGVVVRNIPVTTFDPQQQEQMKNAFTGQNYQLLSKHQIIRMDWISKPRPDKATHNIVINFASKEGANAALAAEYVAWESMPKQTIKYSRACKLLQCFKCYEYGHITRQCRNAERCGHCAGEHLTRDCSAPAEKKCALCKGPHPAWAQSCEHRKKEMARTEIEKEKIRQQPFYPEDPVITPGPSERGSVVSFDLLEVEMEQVLADNPTPAEAVASTTPGAQAIVERLGNKTTTPRSKELASALRPIGVRKTSALKPTLTPLQAKRVMEGHAIAATRERQCEPGSDAIEIEDDSQLEETDLPPTQEDEFMPVLRRRSQRENRRTSNNTTSNE